MPRVAYVNGRYQPFAEACVHVEDRGFQFADGVYEVVAVDGGVLMDEDGHLERLGRSLRELQIPWPMPVRALRQVMREVARRNRITEGTIYVQVTRGVAPRDFKYPKGILPTLVITSRRANLNPTERVEKGVSVITIPDIRWQRRDIKSVALLPQCMGKQRAAEAGAYEAWMVDETGHVTEGTSSNAWIVTADGTLVTRHANTNILRGITRMAVVGLAQQHGIGFQERPFTVAEAYAAREAFMTAATNYVMPITRIDGAPVGDGRPGPIAISLRHAYRASRTGGSR
ncbi:MAG: D-amino-acid transaminase [Rhodospirillaceae bacterium]|nr:D-amino-acid transaminase [Rhodospirillaceae bacterium]